MQSRAIDGSGFIKKSTTYGLIPSGYNPFNYIDCEED